MTCMPPDGIVPAVPRPASAAVGPGDRRQGVDVTAALRLLRQAGRPDPTGRGLDPTTELQAILDGLCELSMRDGLTGLLNASAFRMAVARELERSERTGHPVAVLLIDVDHFKAVNDTYGHAVGDQVLQAVAGCIQSALRSSMDSAGRTGGEEFGAVLPECAPEEAVQAAIRAHCALAPLIVPIGTADIEITVSAGLAWSCPPHSLGPESLLAQADRELYRAKREGRRRLCHPPLPDDRVSVAERLALTLINERENPHGA